MTAELNLKQVAQLLDLHYMTVYRHVRNGRLPARRQGSAWFVDSDDLAAFRRRTAAPAAGVGAPVDWPVRLHPHLLAGDEAGAWAVIEGALSAGMDPEDVLIDVITVAVAATGPEHGPAAGHLVTSTARRSATVLTSRFRRRGRHKGTVVLGAPAGEGHSLGLALLTDLLRLRNVAVLELGVDVPPPAFVDAAGRADRLLAVGIDVTDRQRLGDARDVVLAMRDALPGVPVLVGGQAVADAGMAELAGADDWAPDMRGVADLVDVLLRARGRARQDGPAIRPGWSGR